jgi:thymidylate synthase/broad specificity phosphatase PhoE
MMSEEENANERFIEKYPRISGFIAKPKSTNLPENFNTLYGPRIRRQLPEIINELQTNKNSRRAVISILSEEDLQLLKATDDPNLEFPCADSGTFNIRQNKLHMHLHMRSNNMGNVAKIDMYLWGRLMESIANLLNVELGGVTYTIVSAHIFENDFSYFAKSGILSKLYNHTTEEINLAISSMSSIVKHQFDNITKMNSKVYAIRHAKTINNKDRIYQGGELTAMTPILDCSKEIESLQKFEHIFKRIDTVFCSTYLRTDETFAAIHNRYFDIYHNQNFVFENSALMNEFNLGGKDGTIMDSTVNHLTSLVLYLETFKTKGCKKYDEHGESVIDLLNRITMFVLELGKVLNQQILLVGHGIWLAGLQILLDRASTFASGKSNNLFFYEVKATS